jgi:hypothetical protein
MCRRHKGAIIGLYIYIYIYIRRIKRNSYTCNLRTVTKGGTVSILETQQGYRIFKKVEILQLL